MGPFLFTILCRQRAHCKSCIFSENQILILIWRLWNSLKQKVQEQKWKLRVIPFIWVQYFTNRSIFRGSNHVLFTNVNKSATAKTVEIFNIFSKHKMISMKRQYVWVLKFLTYHIYSWFYKFVYMWSKICNFPTKNPISATELSRTKTNTFLKSPYLVDTHET